MSLTHQLYARVSTRLGPVLHAGQPIVLLVWLGLLGVSVCSGFWFDYPLVLGDKIFPLPTVRRATFVLIVAAMAAYLGHSFLSSSGDRYCGVHPRQTVPPRWIGFSIILIAAICYLRAFPLDLYSGSTYLRQLHAVTEPWRFFDPRVVWSVQDIVGHYRPVGMAFTSAITQLGHGLLIPAAIALHTANALLVSRVVFIFWPANVQAALVAGALAVVLPQALDTVLNPFNQPYLLLAFFYLASIVTFDAAVQKRRLLGLILSGLCFLAALLSVELAITLPFVLLGLTVMRRRFDLRTPFVMYGLLAFFVILGGYLLFYAGYASYSRDLGLGDARIGLVWPLNVKRMILATTYIPLWSFLFPIEELASPRTITREMWLIPVLALPLFWAVVLRIWRDERFIFGILAALATIGPVATFFDMQTVWSSQRHGYLAFLLLCVPYGFLIVKMAGQHEGERDGVQARVWSRQKQVLMGRIAAVAVMASLVVLFGVQMRKFAGAGSLGGRVAAAVASTGSEWPEVGELDVVNTTEVPCWSGPNLGPADDFITTAVAGRISVEFHGSGARPLDQVKGSYQSPQRVNIEGSGCERPDLLVAGTLSDPEAEVEVRWAWARKLQNDVDAAMLANSGGGARPPEVRVAYWNDARGSLHDVTAQLMERFRTSGEPWTRTWQPQVSSGLEPLGNASFIQRGRDGRLLLGRWNGADAMPSRTDELLLELTVEPLGISTFILDTVDLEWTGEGPEGLVRRLRIPITPDGNPHRYRLMLGTSVTWLLTDRVTNVWLRLPPYPSRIRLTQVEAGTR